MNAPAQLRMKLPKVMQQIDLALVIKQPSLLGAIKLAISMAGFEYEKELYADLDIDKGHWTRILNGEAHFPIDKLPELMELCGNEAPLIWLVHRFGYDPVSLRKRESELEQKVRELEAQLADERKKREVITEFVREVRP